MSAELVRVHFPDGSLLEFSSTGDVVPVHTAGLPLYVPGKKGCARLRYQRAYEKRKGQIRSPTRWEPS